MPAMPYAVASLPRKPLQSPYTDDRQHHSNQDASHRRSSHQDKWSSHNGDSYNDDRRSGYSRSSYRINGGSSSSHNSTSSGFHTSASQPSPSSSTTSTASSLRTPPDLLLHGASSLTMPLKGMSTLDGKTKADLAQNQPVHLSVHQLERRLEVCPFDEVVVLESSFMSDVSAPFSFSLNYQRSPSPAICLHLLLVRSYRRIHFLRVRRERLIILRATRARMILKRQIKSKQAVRILK